MRNKINIQLAAHLTVILLCLFLTACNETPQETFQQLVENGNTFYTNNHYQQALEAWTQALAIIPNSPNVYKKIGECHEKAAEYQQALESYYQAVKLQPEHWQTWYKIAKINLSLMNLPDAEKNWNKIKTHINHGDALVFYGDLLLLQRKYAKATTAYRQALTEESENQTAIIRLASCLSAQGENTEAQKLFNKLAASPPQSPDILLQMSNYCSINGKGRLARLFIQQAIKLSPHNPSLKIQLAKLYLETGKNKPAIETLQKLLLATPGNSYAKKMLIETLLTDNQCAQAGQLLETLTETEKNGLDFQFLKGKYYLNTLNFQTAISQFQTILEQEPEMPLAHYLLGLAYLAAGMNNLGRQSLIKTLSLSPEFTEAELALADTYFKTKDYDLALQHVERIKEREPENYRSYLITGNIYLDQKEYQDAITNYQDVQYLSSGNSTASYYKNLCTLSNKKSSINTTTFSSSQRGNSPTPIDIVLHRALFLYQNDQSQQAIQSLQQALKKDQNNPYLHYILGTLYTKKGHHNKAVREFKQALRLKPDLQSAYLMLFKIQQKDNKQLEKLLHTAIAHNRNFYQAYIHLANLYDEKELTAEAITTLEEAMKANPQNPYLANNLAWLYIQHQPESIDKAMGLAQLAYEGLSDNPAAADTLGLIYYQKNMPTRAVWLVEEAIKVAPDNQLIKDHLHTIYSHLKDKNKIHK